MKLSLNILSEVFSKAENVVKEKTNQSTNLLKGVSKDGVKPLGEDCVVTKKVKEGVSKVKKQTIDRVKYFEKIKATKEEIEQLLEMVEDDVVKNYVQKELQSVSANADSSVIHFEKLENLRLLVDSVNSFNGKYSVLASHYEESNLKQLSKFIKENKMQNLYNKENFRKDIELEEKFYSMKEYLTKETNSPMSEYLYDQYYLKSLEKLSGIRDKRNEFMKSMFPDDELKNHLPELIKKIREINSEYGVKVFLDTTALSLDAKDGVLAMDNLATEFSKWKKAGNGKTKFPPVFDTLSTKVEYIDKTAACGDSAADGLSEPLKKGNISVDSIKRLLDKDDKIVRHEMIHTNDYKYENPLFGIPMVYLDMAIRLAGLNKKRVCHVLGTDVDPFTKFITEQIKKQEKEETILKAVDVGIFSPKPNRSIKDFMKNILPKREAPKEVKKENSILYKTLLKHIENAGVDTYHIPYGFNNMFEFIAVLGEGDTAKYPKWLKGVLRVCGMPKSVFKLDNSNF